MFADPHQYVRRRRSSDVIIMDPRSVLCRPMPCYRSGPAEMTSSMASQISSRSALVSTQSRGDRQMQWPVGRCLAGFRMHGPRPSSTYVCLTSLKGRLFFSCRARRRFCSELKCFSNQVLLPGGYHLPSARLYSSETGPSGREWRAPKVEYRRWHLPQLDRRPCCCPAGPVRPVGDCRTGHPWMSTRRWKSDSGRRAEGEAVVWHELLPNHRHRIRSQSRHAPAAKPLNEGKEKKRC